MRLSHVSIQPTTSPTQPYLLQHRSLPHAYSFPKSSPLSLPKSASSSTVAQPRDGLGSHGHRWLERRGGDSSCASRDTRARQARDDAYFAQRVRKKNSPPRSSSPRASMQDLRRQTPPRRPDRRIRRDPPRRRGAPSTSPPY